MVEIQVCSWDSEQDKERAEDLVLGMPTLTPPNEPLTLEELREMNEVPVWIQNLEEPAKANGGYYIGTEGNTLSCKAYQSVVI